MISKNNTVKLVSSAFKKFFSKRSVNASARREGFTKRKPKKLDGFSFLVAMTVGRFKKCTQ